jgi:DNA (cytosine-5)-methyltransferase 1
VDLIHGGIPCQPFSSAGQRVGVDDPRWLWPAFWAATRAADAPAVLLENVPGFRRDALPLVLDDLAASGWDAEWLMLSAGDVGAPHRRDRFWLFAWDRARRDVVADTYSSALRLEPGRGSGADGSDTAVAGHARQELADTYSRGREVVWEGRPGAGQPPRDNTHRRRPFPPCRHDPDGWADWLDGHPGTEPGVRRGADGLAHRLDRLHKAGNGVVPLVAAVAFTRLIRRAFK